MLLQVVSGSVDKFNYVASSLRLTYAMSGTEICVCWYQDLTGQENPLGAIKHGTAAYGPTRLRRHVRYCSDIAHPVLTFPACATTRRCRWRRILRVWNEAFVRRTGQCRWGSSVSEAGTKRVVLARIVLRFCYEIASAAKTYCAMPLLSNVRRRRKGCALRQRHRAFAFAMGCPGLTCRLV